MLRNVFRVFDQDQGSGKINPRDLLLAFTMAMSGSSEMATLCRVQGGLYVVLLAVDDKLHWTFKLYDVDGNGEIDIFEMEKMFVSLCSIVESSENDQLKRNRKEHEKAMLEEKIRKEKEELALILERERELENMKYKVNVLSENFKLKMEKTKNKSSIQRHAPKKKHQKRFSALEENRQKVESCRAMAGQLADPTRDYRKFDSRRRAQVSSEQRQS